LRRLLWWLVRSAVPGERQAAAALQLLCECDRAYSDALLPASQLQLSSGRTLQESRRPGRRPGVQQPSTPSVSSPVGLLQSCSSSRLPQIHSSAGCFSAPGRLLVGRPCPCCSPALRPALSPAARLLVGPCCSAALRSYSLVGIFLYRILIYSMGDGYGENSPL
jgi:hypothetical protein